MLGRGSAFSWLAPRQWDLELPNLLGFAHNLDFGTEPPTPTTRALQLVAGGHYVHAAQGRNVAEGTKPVS